MSKDQKEENKLCRKNVDKLIMSCKMINDIRAGIKYWKFDCIWPTNLYYKTLEEINELINQVLLSNDFSKEPENTIWPIYKK